jgi:hypothetical protein
LQLELQFETTKKNSAAVAGVWRYKNVQLVFTKIGKLFLITLPYTHSVRKIIPTLKFIALSQHKRCFHFNIYTKLEMVINSACHLQSFVFGARARGSRNSEFISLSEIMQIHFLKLVSLARFVCCDFN